MNADEKRPPIPASLAGRPVQRGLAVPWINSRMADGGADSPSTHRAKFEAPWTKGLCQSCGSALSRACLMVAGRVTVYPDRPRLTEGHRDAKCPGGCGCGGWTNIRVIPHHWQLTRHEGTYRCSDLGCEHERVFINGALLLTDPLTFVLVSEPGAGRIWKPVTLAEATEHAVASLESRGLEVPECAA